MGSEEHRLAVKTALERHKQFCTVLMKGRTTEQIADDWLCLLVSTSTFRSLVFGRPEKMLTTSWT